MAGIMATRPVASLPPYLAGAASDTGNILANSTQPIPPAAPKSAAPDRRPQTAVTINRQAAMKIPAPTPPKPPPPPAPPPIVLPDNSGVWGDTGNITGASILPAGAKRLPTPTPPGKNAPIMPSLDTMWGAVADTGNVRQGLPAQPGIDKEPTRWGLVNGNDNNALMAENAIWAGMGPTERQDYTQLRAVLERGILTPDTDVYHDVEKSLHNVIVQGQYRALDQWAHDKQATAGTGPKGSEFGGFFESNVLGGGEQNLYTPNFVLWFDEESGEYSIKNKADAVQEMIVDARRDPKRGGRLLLAMLRAEVIPGAVRNYATQYLRFDANGNPYAIWPTEYDDYVSKLIDRISADQSQMKEPDKFVAGAWETVKQWGDTYRAVMDDATLTDSAYGSGGSGGRGGGYGGYGGYGYGGGGSGGAGSVFLTDSTAIGAMLDSIARNRLGRVMNADEKAAFVDYFHSLETEYSNTYNARAGGTLTQPDLQGQAVAWIEGRYMPEQISESAGEYITALKDFLMKGTGVNEVSV